MATIKVKPPKTIIVRHNLDFGRKAISGIFQDCQVRVNRAKQAKFQNAAGNSKAASEMETGSSVIGSS
jgi:hypothetical protein